MVFTRSILLVCEGSETGSNSTREDRTGVPSRLTCHFILDWQFYVKKIQTLETLSGKKMISSYLIFESKI